MRRDEAQARAEEEEKASRAAIAVSPSAISHIISVVSLCIPLMIPQWLIDLFHNSCYLCVYNYTEGERGKAGFYAEASKRERRCGGGRGGGRRGRWVEEEGEEGDKGRVLCD